MKTLIINASPRKCGHTASLVSLLKTRLQGEIIEIWVFYDKISPCVDCRKCWVEKGCAIKDDMAKIYADDFDVIIIATPIHMSNLPGPLISLASRFQAYYAAKHFLHDPFPVREKRGILIMVGGGDGNTDCAIASAKVIFRILKADLKNENTVLSLKTDVLAATNDADAVRKINEIACRLNGTAHTG